jgi:hypothetical protein
MAYLRRPNAKRSNAASVTTSSSIIVTDNPSRLRITITNNSTNDVSLKLRVSAGAGTPADPTAVANEGIVLKANGGSWTEDAYTGPVAAIAGAAVSVAVTEI